MDRLNITMDKDHMHLLESIRLPHESKSEVIRCALYVLAEARGVSVRYIPAKLEITRKP